MCALAARTSGRSFCMTVAAIVRRGILAFGLVAAAARVAPAGHDRDIALAPIGTYHGGGFNQTASEIAAYDAHSKRLFITNVGARAIDIVDISDPSAPSLVRSISMAPYGQQANSVAV